MKRSSDETSAWSVAPIKVAEVLVALISSWGVTTLLDTSAIQNAGLSQLVQNGVGLFAAVLSVLLWEVVEAYVRDHSRHNSYVRTSDELKQVTDKMSSDLQLVSASVTRLCEALERRELNQALIAKALSFAGRALGPQETSDAWNELTWCVRTSYDATNIIPLKDMYENNFAQDALAVQRAKVRAQGVKIRKVFIFEKLEDTQSQLFKKVLTSHKEPRSVMDARRILTTDNQFAQCTSKLKPEDIDFAIFDQQAVLVWALDKQRQVKGSRILCGHEEVGTFVHAFEALYAAADDAEALSSVTLKV